MALENTLLKIDSLKCEWDAAQPLKTADAERLWRKLRLEWNYNSNHIEGNTLTYGETELLIIFGQTKGDHTIREYEEMKAHDAAIEHVRALAKESQLITEADIRSLNQLILKEPFWKPAITPDGQETRKQIIPGDYKTAPNNVRTATNEVFHFADPLDTPLRMQELVSWLQDRLTKSDLHIAQVISKLHYDFVLIHPFDDGNGRVARLLVNYVLLHLGFPPMVVKSKDKRNYLAALNRADTGDLEAFTEYLAKEVVWGLDLGLRAASGESVEEPDDLDKEIAIFAKQGGETTKAPRKSEESLKRSAEESWIPLLDAIMLKLKPLGAVFGSLDLEIQQIGSDLGSYSLKSSSPPRKWSGYWTEDDNGQNILRLFPTQTSGEPLLPKSISITVNLNGYSASGAQPFNCKGEYSITLDSYWYSVTANAIKSPRYRYDHVWNDSEIQSFAGAFARQILTTVKKMAGRDE